MSDSRARTRLAGWLVPVAAVAAAAVLFLVDPAGSSLLPPCPFHVLTGFACPGCGSTRALHALLHGNPAAALRFNPLFVVALPALSFGTVREWRRIVSGRDPLTWRMPAAWCWACVVAIVAFALLRNLPALAPLLGPPK